MKKNKKLLDDVKISLTVLEDDISFLREFDVSLPSEMSNFLERMNSRYTSAIDKIVRENEGGYSDLEDILVNINETRLQQYQKAAKSMLQMTRKELKNAFWFKYHFSISQKMDDIEKRILEIDSSLTSKELTKIEKSINLYRDQINILGQIQHSFQGERRRSRWNISLSVLFWSLPILIGISISDKFDDSTIFAFIVVMVLFAALSYLFVGCKRFDGIISQNKIVLIISLFVLIAVIFLWLFYIPISSYFSVYDGLIGNVIFPSIIMMIVGMNFLSIMNLPENFAKRNFVVVIPAIDRKFSPGDKIIVPFSLENKRSSVITEIGVHISAPGLSVLYRRENTLYKSMGGKSTENAELNLLDVPKEAVSGEYIIEFDWNFYVGIKRYTKTNEIKVHVGM